MNVQPNVIGGRSNAAPLTEKGKAQAAALGRRLAALGVGIDLVFTSPAVRARETARITIDAMGLQKSIVESPEVLEICQGEWTGQERDVVYDEAFIERVEREKCFLRPPGVSVGDALPGGSPPPGESQWDVECRVAAFVEGLLSSSFPEGSPDGAAGGVRQTTVAVFMHGVAIKAFLRRAMGASSTFAVHSCCDNTSITELVYKTGYHNLHGWQVVRMNDSAHLEGL